MLFHEVSSRENNCSSPEFHFLSRNFNPFEGNMLNFKVEIFGYRCTKYVIGTFCEGKFAAKIFASEFPLNETFAERNFHRRESSPNHRP